MSAQKQMAASKFAQRPMAETIGTVSTDSVLSTIEGKASTESATAPRSESLKTGKSVNFSGQYLYDRFIANNKEEVTKMDLVRKMASALDVHSFSKVLTEFVNIAKGGDKVKGADLTGQQAANYKTALNHVSVLKLAYGAIRFAGDALSAIGYTDTTGYQVMRVLSKQALDDTGIKWDGTKALTKEAREVKATHKLEAAAIEDVMSTMPRNEGESRADYLSRIDQAVENNVKAKREEAHKALVEKLAGRFMDEAGALLPEVIEYLTTPVGEHINKLSEKEAVKAAPAATKH